MRILLISSVLSLLFWSCANTGIDSEEVIERFTNPKIDAGYIIIPVKTEMFIVLDNSIMRARVYYDNYKDSFTSYTEFLRNALNCPGTIDFCYTIGICDGYEYKKVRELRCQFNYHSFVKFYLNELDTGIYTIKQQHRDKWPYILAYCFYHGFYLYFSDYSAEWIISETPDDNLDYLIAE